MRGICFMMMGMMASQLRRVMIGPVHRTTVHDPEMDWTRSWEYLPRIDPVVFARTQAIHPGRIAAVWTTKKGRIGFLQKLIAPEKHIQQNPVAHEIVKNMTDKNMYDRLPEGYEIEEARIASTSVYSTPRIFVSLLLRSTFTRSMWEVIPKMEETWQWRRITEIRDDDVPLLPRALSLHSDNRTLQIMDLGTNLIHVDVHTGHILFKKRLLPNGGVMAIENYDNLFVFTGGGSSVYVVIDKETVIEATTSSALVTTPEWSSVSIERITIEMVEMRPMEVVQFHALSRCGCMASWRAVLNTTFEGESVRCTSVVRLPTGWTTPQSKAFLGRNGKTWVIDSPLRVFPREFKNSSVVGVVMEDRDNLLSFPSSRSAMVHWTGNDVWIWDLEDRLVEAFKGTKKPTPLTTFPVQWFLEKMT